MATEVATAEGAAAPRVDQARPYAPSWVDALMRAMERIPGPTWLAYVGLLVAALATTNFEGWLVGVAPGDLVQSFYAFFFVFPLAVVHYLSLGARDAWDRFRPATVLDDADAAEIRYRLSVMPARSVAVLLAMGAATNLAWMAADPVGVAISGRPPLYVALRAITESVLFGMVFVLIYQVVRQLRLVSRLHQSAATVDLLRPGPLHAMSRLTSRAAMGLIVLAVASGAPTPGMPEPSWLAIVVGFSLPILVVALAVFFVPLRGMNRRLVEEKARLLDGISERLQTASAALHRVVDQEAANERDADASRVAQTRIDALNKALASLLQERDFVRHQSTWPWDPTTFRAVASVIALPIVLFLITRALDRFI